MPYVGSLQAELLLLDLLCEAPQDLTDFNATDSTHTIGAKDWLYLLKGVNLVSGSILFHFRMLADKSHAPGQHSATLLV